MDYAHETHINQIKLSIRDIHSKRFLFYYYSANLEIYMVVCCISIKCCSLNILLFNYHSCYFAPVSYRHCI